MLSWIIQITLISIILVFLIHHLINFFKATLTVPKIKDLVNVPTQKYENMLNIIKNNSNNSSSYNTNDYLKEYKIVDLLPQSDEPTMKSELKSFLKKQLNPTATSGTDISALDSMISSNSYSEFKL